MEYSKQIITLTLLNHMNFYALFRYILTKKRWKEPLHVLNGALDLRTKQWMDREETVK